MTRKNGKRAIRGDSPSNRDNRCVSAPRLPEELRNPDRESESAPNLLPAGTSEELRKQEGLNRS
jgi:hypothetical protein